MASGPIRSNPATVARPAITIENSPRATIVVLARIRPRWATPSRRAAYQPVATLVNVVTKARASAAGSAGRISLGATRSPKERKKIVAKRSRSGVRTSRALRGLAGNREADQESADRGGGVHQVRQASYQQREPEHPEQDLLVVLVVEEPAQAIAEAASDEQHDRGGAESQDRSGPGSTWTSCPVPVRSAPPASAGSASIRPASARCWPRWWRWPRSPTGSPSPT
jgi:hypothetical protein